MPGTPPDRTASLANTAHGDADEKGTLKPVALEQNPEVAPPPSSLEGEASAAPVVKAPAKTRPAQPRRVSGDCADPKLLLLPVLLAIVVLVGLVVMLMPGASTDAVTSAPTDGGAIEQGIAPYEGAGSARAP